MLAFATDLKRLADENASLRAELAKARKDTERLDWLEKQNQPWGNHGVPGQEAMNSIEFDWFRGDSLRAGIDAALGIFTAAPEAARARLGAARVDYLLVCPADADIRFFAARTPNGLIAELVRGNVPAWLEPVGAAGPTVIYRVHPG
jgi:hypothetical protein